MIIYSNTDSKKPHMVFIGRWMPLHKGHIEIIRKKIKENPDVPVLILVRDTAFDEFSACERGLVIKAWMISENIHGTIMVIPDIKGVYYGRSVGYDVEEVPVTTDIQGISGTEIRRAIIAGDESWKKLVAPGTEKIIEEMYDAKTD